MVRIILIALSCIPVFSEGKAQPYQSAHFSLQKLGEGVYAAIATPGGHAICNAGIIDMGREVMVVDPFMNPDAAEDLKAAVKALTGKKVKYVVNTHWHDDHIGGNQVFEKAQIISSEQTRELILKNIDGDRKENEKNAPAVLASLKKADSSGMPEFDKVELNMWLGYFEGIVQSTGIIRTVIPDRAINRECVIHGRKKEIILKVAGRGHTENDLIVFIRGEGILFAGDLVFINNHAWMGDGDADDWKICLDSLSALDIKKLVPGHGPVGNRTDIPLFGEYLNLVRKTAVSCRDRGTDPGAEHSLTVPAPYNDWHLQRFFKPNVMGEYQKLIGSKQN